jgi:hypothetical protein
MRCLCMSRRRCNLTMTSIVSSCHEYICLAVLHASCLSTNFASSLSASGVAELAGSMHDL